MARTIITLVAHCYMFYAKGHCSMLFFQRPRTNFVFHNSDAESTDFEFVGSKFRKTLSNVLISLISSITYPVLSTIFTVVVFLSMFWAVVLTSIVVKHIILSLKTKISCKRRNPQAIPNV